MNVKQKGNRFEQLVARMLRKYFPDVATSRERNKWLDNQGVDLVNTGCFYIQCKHVERGLDPHKVLEEMPKSNKLNVLLWKRNRKGTLVVMNMEDATEVVRMLRREKII
jgi:hypothetical protein